MKNLFLICIMLISAAVSAQKDQYVEVTYVMEMEMDADEVIASIPQEYRAMVESSIRQELADGIYIDYTLKAGNGESAYKMVEQISNAQSQTGMIAQQMRTFDKEVTYKNLNEGIYLKPVDIMGTLYLLKDKLQDHKWKVSRETEKIAGYDARLATGELVSGDSIIPVKAWYTPKISIKEGPSSVWGLPGLILKTEFEVNGALLTLTAKEIFLREEPIEIKRPSGGKEVTQKEFEAEMKALQERAKEMMEGGVDTD